MSKNIYEMLNEVEADIEELQKQYFTEFKKSKVKKTLDEA